MLEFKPGHVKDNIFSFTAFENGEEIGSCTFSVDAQLMEILSLAADNNDLQIEEGLVRSALNFGANRSVYMVRLNPAKVSSPVFCAMGFVQRAGFLSCDIPGALQGNCDKCK